MDWGEENFIFTLLFCFRTVTTPKQLNASVKRDSKKDAWVGEVPAKDSLTDVCMFKQGD